MPNRHVDIGLVTAIGGDVVAAAQRMGEHIAGFEPYGVMMSKRLLAASSTASLDTRLDAELTAQTVGFFTDTAQTLGNQR